MGAGSGKIRAAAVLFGVALLCGCAAPQQQAVKEKKPSPVSVHLPVLETTETDARMTPVGARPQLHPTDVDDGIARSLNMVEIQFYLKKPAPPPAGPAEDLGGP